MAMEIAVRGLFATPVAAVMLPDAEARNARLHTTSLDRRRQHSSIRSSTIQPKPGLLFPFPFSLMHQVGPYRGNGLRVSLAFKFGVP
jgi:hypothetical protein